MSSGDYILQKRFGGLGWRFQSRQSGTMNGLDTGRKRPLKAKSPDPLWVWAERAGRLDDDSQPQLAEEAAARMRLLQQSAGNFAARLPGVDEWAAFLRAEIIPVFNKLVPHDRMCLECGKRMGDKKATIHVCSPECASRYEARRRPRGAAGTGGASPKVRPHEPADTAKISLGVAAVGLEKKRK
jgi:hypothetical protein